MKTVLYIQSTGKVAARLKLKGVYAHAAVHDWNLQVIESVASEKSVRELLDFWHPAGVIVECGSASNPFAPGLFRPTPVVFLDRNPKTLPEPAFCVSHDSAATARVAAKELLLLRLAAYAYLPWPEPRFWSEEREAGFAAALRLNGKGYTRFEAKWNGRSVPELQAKLADWLGDLPKPVGVFAANDQMAGHLIAAAARAGIAVPDDLAVVGVDNDELLCENAKPSLSSVTADFQSAGTMAAKMLDRIMENRRLRPETETFGPLRLVRRASTARSEKCDAHVRAALDLIRRRACEGLRARDVFALFPCSRRMAEIRFRAATGRSVLDEIQSVRRARAEELLKDPSLDRTAVANFCGYASANALMNFLRADRA